MSREHLPGMSILVKTMTRLTVGFVFLFGIYVLSHGHVAPGGGFAGGVIIALSFVLLMLAYGKEVALKKLPQGITLFYEGNWAISSFAVVLLVFTVAYFILNFVGQGEPSKLFSVGTIVLNNVTVIVKVGAGLFSIFAALVLLRFESEK